jgi:hypothetical protein
MSEEAPQYQVSMPKQKAWRIKIEAEALRHIDNLREDERTEAVEKLFRATHETIPLVQRAREVWTATPNAGLSDIALCLDDPLLDVVRADLESAGALAIATGVEAVDPDKAKQSFSAALQDHKDTGAARSMAHVEKLAQAWQNAPDHQTRTGIEEQIEDALRHKERTFERPLSELWAEYAPGIKRPGSHKPHEAVMLDGEKRGLWAHWFNRHLGPKGGLAPGQTLLIGGVPGGGKTSMGAALAVDALAGGCPVAFHQLELGVTATIEHLLSQDPALKGEYGVPHHKTKMRDRVPMEIPAHWEELLTIPRWPSANAEDIAASMREMAARAKRMRRSGQTKHECNGMIVVDYVQRLRMESAKSYQAEHSVLTDAVSMLAHTAEECGAVLVLLSQVTKSSRPKAGENKEQRATGAEYSGGDLERVAYAACTIFKGKWIPEGDTGKVVPTSGGDSEEVSGKGKPRIVDFTKDRGILAHQNGGHPASEAVLWYQHRAIYGDDDAFPKEKEEMATREAARDAKERLF